jgi:hypothetical protein
MKFLMFMNFAVGASFADKIIQGFNSILSFIAKTFGGLFDLIATGFNKLIQFLAKPLAYLYAFLEGVFYFFTKLFDIAVAIVKIFVACFQFVLALIAGIFRTIKRWLTVQPKEDLNFPSVSNKGFETVMDIVEPTGLLTVVPMVALAFLWFFFAIKMIGLFGGSIYIKPYGRGDD